MVVQGAMNQANNLQAAQMIGELGSQMARVARTEGQIAAISDGKAELAKKNIHEPTSGKEADWNEYNALLKDTKSYKDAMDQWGTGSTIQRTIQAATAAVQGLAGGDIAAALAGGAAPFIANVIGKQIPEDNLLGRALAHATVNAALAAAQGKDMGVAAAGAATGEIVAAIAVNGYGKPVSELTENEKQTVSALATLASGLAGGLIGGSGADAMAAAQVGKTTAENNALSNKYGVSKLDEKGLALFKKLKDAGIGDIDELQQEFQGCNGRSECERDVRNKYRALEAEAGQKLVQLYQSGVLTQDDYEYFIINYANAMLEGVKEGQQSSPWAGVRGDIYDASANDWTPAGVAGNPYISSIRNAEQLAKWVSEGLTNEQINDLMLKDGIVGTSLTPADFNKITNLIDNGASKEQIYRSAAGLIFGKLISGPKSNVQNGKENATASLTPATFSADVTKHNVQTGVLNRKQGTISGAHKQDAFLESVEMTGAKVNLTIKDKSYPGLVEYRYQIPSVNNKGEQIGYKSEQTKTTYDPRILSDDKVASMSNKAAQQADVFFQKNPDNRQFSAKVDGYWFQVTRDAKTGTINNAFITMPQRGSK